MYQIGVDIGGTNIKIGLVDDSLEIVSRASIRFPHESARTVVEAFSAAIRDVLAKKGAAEKELESIGIVVPGSISPDGASVIDAYNLDFHNVPLRALTQAQFPGIPVFLANDANGAALAELVKGAFVGCRTAVLFTLGTGLGGGLILDGKMFNGGMNQGVELGHAYLVDGGEPCTCGNRGCMEAYCAASALAREGAREMRACHDSLLYIRAGGKEQRVDAKLVTDCAKEGDEAAAKVFRRYVNYLCMALDTVTAFLDPEVIILGGGVSRAGNFLLDAVRERLPRYLLFKSMPYPRIEIARLGADAGMIGAAMLGKQPVKEA